MNFGGVEAKYFLGLSWCLRIFVGNNIFFEFCRCPSSLLLHACIKCMTLGKEGQDLGEAFISRALAFIDRHSGQCAWLGEIYCDGQWQCQAATASFSCTFLVSFWNSHQMMQISCFGI